MAQFTACGVTFELPDGWEDRSVHQFVAATPAYQGAGEPSANAPLETSISVTRLGPTTLERAVSGLTAPEAEEVTVLRAERRQTDSGEYYERVIRFSDPVRGGAVQQSLRLIELGGQVYALGFIARPADFNEAYRLFSMAAEQFASQKRKRT